MTVIALVPHNSRESGRRNVEQTAALFAVVQRILERESRKAGLAELPGVTNVECARGLSEDRRVIAARDLCISRST